MELPLQRFIVVARECINSVKQGLKRPKAGVIVLAKSEESAQELARAIDEGMRDWIGPIEAISLPYFHQRTEFEPYGIAVSIINTPSGIKYQYVLLDKNYEVLCAKKNCSDIKREYRKRNSAIFERDSSTNAPTLRFIPTQKNGVIEIIDLVENKVISKWTDNKGGVRFSPRLPEKVKSKLLELSHETSNVIA
ncbi:MAG: hypothetical protein ABJH04_07540 [Cyclobacteriaceae bacterium]